MARQRDISIDRDAILRAGFALLEDAGLDGVTMRALAARLSVQAPALYWHVRDKAELLAMMAEDIYARGRAGLVTCSDAHGWLLELGRGLARVLYNHRDSARLLAVAAPAREADEDRAQEMAGALRHYGFSVEAALEAQASVLSLTVGWALYRENAAMAAHLKRMFDLDASYAKGLELLVDGLVRQSGR
jgi:TetR/AcrR family tetracycline transcriptional repressor